MHSNYFVSCDHDLGIPSKNYGAQDLVYKELIGINNYSYSDLEPYTSYSVSLAAISDHGTGPFTEEIKVQTYEGGKSVTSIIAFRIMLG